MVRGLDHVVAAVQDLDAAARAWEALGFSVTPKAVHPWGTANRLIQLDGFFIELLALDDASLIQDAGEGAFSFGAFNRDYLALGKEGMTMLVAESRDPQADRAAFQELGLQTFEPFSFGRKAVQPDGSVREVGFDLTFTAEPLAPEIGFFTCYNRFPENFWKPAYQTHQNGARSLKGVTMVAADPSDHHEFLGGFTGQREMRATSLGLEMDTPRGTISVLTPRAYRFRDGDAAADSLPSSPPVLAALEVACEGLSERKVIPARDLFGITLALVPA
ncbi:VOC family protein [Roseibium suaedae]|uniref:Glyoxalase-like domain-containing protein n=1 Tax=Roseibium suaedae TaxID=735517 RepID=A0A1M7KWD5_9HYPH|nr:VOC family protein [Roseibium suaedae]SHM69953.1 Glyoxalase-like domain-containing protein [Roseibium suaedae]